MAKALLLAPSGSGKTFSMKNLDPEKSVVIQAKRKELPFEGAAKWKKWETGKGGSRIYIRDITGLQGFIEQAIGNYGKKIIIIDDFVYYMMTKVMDDINTTGFTKWVEVADQVFKLFDYMDSIEDENIRFYVMTHPDTDENGTIKAKTAGALIDKCLNIEG